MYEWTYSHVFTLLLIILCKEGIMYNQMPCFWYELFFPCRWHYYITTESDVMLFLTVVIAKRLCMYNKRMYSFKL